MNRFKKHISTILKIPHLTMLIIFIIGFTNPVLAKKPVYEIIIQDHLDMHIFVVDCYLHFE